MKRTLGATLLLAAFLPVAAGAQESETRAAAANDDRTTPRGRSEQEVLLSDRLFAIPGKQVHLLRIEYPAGWVGRRHYHTGDVVLYVLDGRFTVDVEGGGRKTIGPGEVYHEAVNKEMQARNASTTEATTILLFQVGDPGERTTVVTD